MGLLLFIFRIIGSIRINIELNFEYFERMLSKPKIEIVTDIVEYTDSAKNIFVTFVKDQYADNPRYVSIEGQLNSTFEDLDLLQG